MNPRILIIAGMHRSGTTLTARWLHGCGLHLGENLLRSKYEHANPEGLHYEDVDFLELHRKVLQASGLSGDGYLTQEAVSLLPQYADQAQNLIATRNHLQQWGWKEPRTCLFLADWRSLLPDAKLLVVYRPAAKVADSLLRRKLDHPRPMRRQVYRWQFRDTDSHAAHLIRVWDRYNRDILQAVDTAPEDALVLRIGDLVPQSKAILEFLRDEWGFDLALHEAGEIYEQKRMRKETSYVDESAPQTAAALEAAQPTHAALENWRSRSMDRL